MKICFRCNPASKIQAFTLGELVASMVILSIIISISFSSLYFLKIYQSSYNKNMDILLESHFIENLLYKDIRGSKNIEILDKSRIIIQYDSKNIEWQNRASFVIRRENDAIDSFEYKLGQLNFFIKTDEINKSKTIEIIREDTLILNKIKIFPSLK